jgi:hypothetical protein
MKILFAISMLVFGSTLALASSDQAPVRRPTKFICECLVENPGGLNRSLGNAIGHGYLVEYAEADGRVFTYTDVSAEVICANRFGKNRNYVGVCATSDQLKKSREVIRDSNLYYGNLPPKIGGLQKRLRPTASDFVIDTFSGNRQRPPSTVDPSWYNFCRVHKCGPGQSRGYQR